MIFAKDSYSNGSNPMPDRDNKKISAKEKDSAKYNIAMSRSFYSEFCGGRTFGGADLYNQIDELRSYAYGQQSEERYKDSFYGKSSNGVISTGEGEDRFAKRKAYSALNFSVMSPAPRVMDALLGKISKATDMVSVDPTDQYSSNLKEDLKWGTYVDGKFNQMFQSLKALGGIPHEAPMYIPRNLDELNLYDAEGGFKLSYAEVMEELVYYTMNLSRWEEDIQDRVIFDLITCGFSAVEDIYDEQTGQVRAEYRDCKYTGVQYTREDGYSKPDYGFTIVMMKVSDLRAKGFSEEQLIGLAKKFADKFGNGADDDWSKANNDNPYSKLYDEFTVPVLKSYWLDVEYDRELEYTSRTGKKSYSIYNGEKLDNRRKIIETRIKYLRGSSWILDTEMVFDYGKVKNQARDGMAHPVVPIRMVKTLGRPLIPRVIPALDLYMNSWMKFQQGIRMAALNGFSIEMGSITNLSLGNKKLNPIEVIKMWRETGIMFRKDTNVVGQMNVASRAIEPIAGGAGAMLQEALSGMEISIKLIEETTGINPVSLGATPNQGQGKGLTEYAMGATDVILGQIVKRVNILKQDVAKGCCLRLQQVVRDHQKAKKLYGAIIGDTRLKLLEIAEGHDVAYGITTRVRPTQEEQQYLIDMISLSLKNGRDGKVGITEADAVKFFSMIKSGKSLKRVSLLLDFANKKAQEEAEARAMRSQQAEAEKNNEYAMLQAQMEERKVMLNTQSQGMIATNGGHIDLVIKAYEKGDLTYEQAMGMLMPQAPQKSGGIEQQSPQGQGQQAQMQ